MRIAVGSDHAGVHRTRLPAQHRPDVGHEADDGPCDATVVAPAIAGLVVRSWMNGVPPGIRGRPDERNDVVAGLEVR
jgi:ribose 5-phosphate isomerase RpiB